MKQSNSACTLLIVLVLVLAGREVQRSFFGDSDELAQDFTADELAGLLGFNKGTWELPELTDENYLSIYVEVDGVDQGGGGYPKDATDMERLKGKEEVPFTQRYWHSGEKSKNRGDRTKTSPMRTKRVLWYMKTRVEVG